MTKENFLLHKHVGNGSKNTKKDTQTWNIKKRKEKKSNYEREIHVKYTLRHEDERHVEKKEKK